jgi:hypothetical protein
MQLYEENNACSKLVYTSSTGLREIGRNVGKVMEVAQVMSSSDVGFGVVETSGYDKLFCGKFTSL